MTTHHKVRRRSGRQSISMRQAAIIGGVAVLAVAVLIGLNLAQPRPGLDLTGPFPYPTGVTPEGEPYRGSPDAPLQLIEYSDFLCPHCAEMSNALTALAPDYIQTGKLRVIFRNFAFLTPESTAAAEASECALNQGADKFWHYHDLSYARQGDGLSAYTPTQLKAYAAEMGLDTTAFNTCLDSQATLSKVQADVNEGTSQGVKATPTWFLNGQMEEGAMTEAELRTLFDDTLAKTKGS